MTKKQLFALYICLLVPYISGSSLVPFLPIYVEQLGASSSITGYYLAISFSVLAIGTFVAGWASQRFQRRKLMLLISFAGSVVGLGLMAFATNLILLTIATCIVWFMGGIITTIVYIMTGMFAEEAERGRTFGILASAISVASIISGSYTGLVIEQSGYPTLFLITGALFIIPMFAVVLLEDRQIEISSKQKNDVPKIELGQVFWFLFFAALLVNAANFATTMVRPILMDSLAFDARAIASTISVMGFVTLPIPYIFGGLSDRFGRKPILILVYVIATLGFAVTAFSTDLWHFWLSTIFTGSLATGLAIGSALLTDITAPKALDTALSRFASTQWIGGVMGYLIAGVAIDQLGMLNTLLGGVLVALIAIILIFQIQSAAKVKVVH